MLDDIKNTKVNIDDIFQECIIKEQIASENAIISDIYSIIKIMDFYNEYMLIDKQKKLNQYTTTLIVVLMNFILYEIIQCENSKISREEHENINKNLRYAVHQFRKNNFNDRDDIIIKNMGISTDELNPMLDFTLYFIKNENEKRFIGTNIWEEYVIQNNFNKEITYQKYANMLMNFFTTIYTILVESGLKDDDYKLKKINKKESKIIYQPYSFVSLIRKSKIVEEKILRRLLIAYSQLATIDTMFKELIDINDNEIINSYILYFLNKIIAYVLDETYDNIQSYIKNTKDLKIKEDLKNILYTFGKIDCEKNRRLRNNFHYTKQDKVFSNKEEMLIYLKENLKYTSVIMNQITHLLNIRDRKIIFAFFRLLRWTEYGYKAENNK